jgi:hypothetical protein
LSVYNEFGEPEPERIITMKLTKLAVAARPLPLVSLVTLTAHTRVE